MTTQLSPDTALPTQPYREEDRDLGFGSVVSRRAGQRLLNRDGSFNVARTGLGFWRSLSLYHWLLTMSWPRFFALVVAANLAANAVFAGLFVLIGPGALAGPGFDGSFGPFEQAFFFSVQTLATIGYGHVHPAGIAANVLVTVESLAGLLGFALATGMVFARFSRPVARIIFSRVAVMAPYRGHSGLMFRIANARRNEVVELEAKVVLSRFEPNDDGALMRRYYPLVLERQKVAFFPLSWTIVHPIDDASPLAGWSEERLRTANTEILVLLTGLDDTFSQTVHARSSYTMDDIVCNARFASMFEQEEDRTRTGRLAVNIGRLDEVVPA